MRSPIFFIRVRQEGQERVKVCLTMNTEIRMMWPPAKECWQVVDI